MTIHKFTTKRYNITGSVHYFGITGKDPIFKVFLNNLQECHQNMLTRIKQVAPDFIYKNIRLLQYDTNMDMEDFESSLQQKISSQSLENLNTYQESNIKAKNLNSFSFDYDMGPSSYSDSDGSTFNLEQPMIGNERRNSIKEIQNKLESNGCSLLVKASHMQNDIKPKLPKNRALLIIHCKYCGEGFPNNKFLAKHQLMHMSVSDRRIFDKKCLDKSVRRGRLIPVDDKKCIRCLNCWKLFEDNRKILEHWSNADCEFFCQICGEEFARNPKQLREHVPEVHGITYKSSRRQVANIPEVRILNKPIPNDVKPPLRLLMPKLQPEVKSPPAGPPAKKSKTILTANGRVSCNLCSCTFPNYQSKNSHMRAHKGQINLQSALVGKMQLDEDVPPLLSAVTIKREKNDDVEDEDDEDSTQLLVRMEPSGQRIKREKLDDTKDSEPVRNGGAVAKDSFVSPAKSLEAKPAPAAMTAKKQPPSANNAQSTSGKKPNQDHMQYDKMYNCHPCGKKFTSKTDLFQHKRLCQSNNKFGCRFCLRAFVTSADLQMHIMLMHKGS